MNDLGRKFTDQQIAEIEKQLKKEYAQALKEMQAKCNKVLSNFEKTDALMRAKEQKGDITHKQYIEWRNRAILKNKQVQGMVQDLTERAVNADKIAADYINGRILRVFAENTNFATYEIEKQARIDTNFTLVSEDAVSGLVTGRTPIFPIAKVDVPKDKKWNEQKIRSAITQGVLQGEAISKVASRLQRVTDMDRTSATRNARTLMGRAQNAGRMESIKRAHDLGLPVKKIWIATLDNRTRDSHVDLDGEVQEYNAPFSNGLEYPCASGPPEEVYNCRCDMRPIYEGSKFNASDLGLRNTSHMEEQSYQEWKDAHKKQEKQKAVVIQNQLIMPQRPQRENFATEELFQEARMAYRESRKVYSEQKEQLIDEWMNEPIKYQTPDDIRAWAESRNVRLLNDVETLTDPRALSPVLDALDEMFTKYPEVKKMFDDASYWGIDYEHNEQYLMAANGGLKLSRSFLNAENVFNEVINGQAESFFTRGTGDLATLVRHEYGHNMDSYLRTKFNTLGSTYEWKKSGKLDRRLEASKKYDKELIEITLKHGSEYSRTNTLEAFAEGFSEYTSNPNSEYGKAFGKFFERWYHASPIE